MARRRRRYTKGTQDRAKYHRGSHNYERESSSWIPHNPNEAGHRASDGSTASGPVPSTVPYPGRVTDADKGPITPEVRKEQLGQRAGRIADYDAVSKRALEGKVPEAAKLPPAVKAGYKRVWVPHEIQPYGPPGTKGPFRIGDDQEIGADWYRDKPSGRWEMVRDEELEADTKQMQEQYGQVGGPSAQAARRDVFTASPAERIGQREPITAQTYDSAQAARAAVGPAAQGAVSQQVDQIGAIQQRERATAVTAPTEQQMNAAKATNVEGALSAGAFATQVTGTGGLVNQTPQAEQQSRAILTGTQAQGNERQIQGVPTFLTASERSSRGLSATQTAQDLLNFVAELPSDVSAAILDDPTTFIAQLDNQTTTVQAATAALPPEALVSAQLEALLGGLEAGEVPTWAKPAVDQVNQIMADRGLDVSTVGRDALFNAIIQNGISIAQENARAIQQRATQNLSNEQQAQLAETQNGQQLRLQNLANSQEAARQTAVMAQQVALQQGEFMQQATLTTAQQAQQSRLTQFQTAADFLAKNTAFAQQMELANLSNDQQMRLANLTSKNQAASEQLSADEKVELANLQSRLEVNTLNAKLAQELGVAQLNVDQQRAMQHASVTANMDMTKFTTAQQVELANSKFMQTTTLQDFSQKQQAAMQQATIMAQLDMATADQNTKRSIENARNFLQMDMANLNNEQQGVVLQAQLDQQRMLSDQAAENAARQFNSTSVNQTNQFMANLQTQVDVNNAARNDAMQQFNATQQNAAEAQRAQLGTQVSLANSQLAAQIDQFNEQINFQQEQFNVQNAQAIEQSNVQWRRQANTINTAAQNSINQQNAQNAFQLSTQQLSNLWQETRDEMDFAFKVSDNDLSRKASLMVAALGNDSAAYEGKGWSSNLSSITSILDNFLGGG